MKTATALRRAAKLIETGYEHYSCYALQNVVNGNAPRGEIYTKWERGGECNAYAEVYFNAPKRGDSAALRFSKKVNKCLGGQLHGEARDWRVLLLCFAAAVIESEECNPTS